MRILISNDDGIYSPGIRVLAEVATEYGDVRIVAPDVERSSAGHAITHSRPLSYRRTSIQGLTAYRVNGTPADCVSLGAYQWGKVDLVLSGLNIGLNLGNSIWHSGTVAAARQAALLGIRGVALSAPAGAEPDFAPYVRRAPRKIPIAIWVGTNDGFFPLAPVRATRDALNKEGFDAQLTEIRGHTHDYYGRSSEINKAAWAFLRDKRLDFDPQFQQYVIAR